MKRLITRTLAILILCAATIGLFSTFLCKKHYYYSPDSSRIVTRLDYLPYVLPQSTYFIPGRYKSILPPSTYIKPIYSGRDGGFVLLIHWTDSGCIFYYPHGLYKSDGLSPEFQLKEADEGSESWREMVEDTLSGTNTLLNDFSY